MAYTTTVTWSRGNTGAGEYETNFSSISGLASNSGNKVTFSHSGTATISLAYTGGGVTEYAHYCRVLKNGSEILRASPSSKTKTLSNYSINAGDSFLVYQYTDSSSYPIATCSCIITMTSLAATARPSSTLIGTVSPSANYGVSGTNVTFVASPKNGAKFVGWYNSSNQKLSDNASYTFTLSSDIELIAKFITPSIYLKLNGHWKEII